MFLPSIDNNIVSNVSRMDGRYCVWKPVTLKQHKYQIFTHDNF